MNVNNVIEDRQRVWPKGAAALCYPIGSYGTDRKPFIAASIAKISYGYTGIKRIGGEFTVDTRHWLVVTESDFRECVAETSLRERHRIMEIMAKAAPSVSPNDQERISQALSDAGFIHMSHHLHQSNIM